ncbi:MAG: energy-coupling factor transporter ATPase [Clostridia bacterium]|nr:energy-coupling factor transporter ATPase [Clostridia bacterium]
MPIVVERLTYRYDPADRDSPPALREISLSIADGERVGLAGATGSGKTTLALHFNGLLSPTEGRVVVDGIDPCAPGLSRAARARARRELRRKVGIVFQYPETQLFEETVADDIAYGPRNLGLPEDEVQARVRRAMQDVGLDPALARRSPFQLSGGQMRRVALAGVLAIDPDILVLDEPTAGLDPQGREALLDFIGRWQRGGSRPRTLVYVSHAMDEMATLVDRMVVLHRGEVVADGPPREVFARADLRQWGLEPPPATAFLRGLAACGWPVRADALTLDEARARVAAAWRARDGARHGAGGAAAGPDGQPRGGRRPARPGEAQA